MSGLDAFDDPAAPVPTRAATAPTTSLRELLDRTVADLDDAPAGASLGRRPPGSIDPPPPAEPAPDPVELDPLVDPAPSEREPDLSFAEPLDLTVDLDALLGPVTDVDPFDDDTDFEIEDGDMDDDGALDDDF